MTARPARGWLSRWRTRFSFPLLVKELTETAARRRTYTLRVVYALALYALFVLIVPARAWTGRDLGYGGMGMGRQMLQVLVITQFLGVALFLPALMCGRITQEKERDSLVLLFLTELSPWSIVFQKYLGGLIPMFSLFLLGLPLAGVAYAYGGVDSHELVSNSWALVLTVLQVAAGSLLCSAWCRSTVGAFLTTYFFFGVFYAGPPLLGFLLKKIAPGVFEDIDLDEYVFLHIPPAAMDQLWHGSSHWGLTLAPPVLSTLLFLSLARRFLIRRAFLPASTFIRRLFQRMDAFMRRMNRATGGVVIWHRATDLPAEDPILWRETRRRALGRPNYLIRVLYAIEIPTLILCFLAALSGPSYPGQYYGLSFFLLVWSAVAALVMSAHSANTIVSERVDQTLEVLLTTTMSAREIIRQKERALWRLLIVIAIPLLTIMACEALLEGNDFRLRSAQTAYLVCGILLVVIYLPLIAWLSLWIGLRVRTRFQAIVSAVGALTFWASLCPLLVYLLARFETHTHASDNSWALTLLSPVTMGFANEINEVTQLLKFSDSAWTAIAMNTVFYAAIAFFIRSRLFADAEKFLRR